MPQLPPTALTRTSIRPSSLAASFTMASAEAGSATSVRMQRHRRPAASIARVTAAKPAS